MKVRLITYTQNPEEIVGTACYTCCSEEDPDIIFDEVMHGEREIKNFIRKVIRSGHLSVLGHANFTFAISGISRVCSHQLVRHRHGDYTQQSQRYVKFEDDFENCVVIPESFEAGHVIRFTSIIREIQAFYKILIRDKIKPEDARFTNPNAFTTTFTLTMNATELRHVFGLRCCNCAQWEIRELANKMLEQVKEVAPLLFENAGAKCLQLGYCNEPKERSCGMMPHKDDVLDNWREHYPKKKKDEEEHEMTQDEHQDYIEKCMTGENLK